MTEDSRLDGASVDRAPSSRSSRGRPTALLERWDPIYFAFVMATGIVSVAARDLGLGDVGRTLFWTNVVAFVVVGALTLARVARFPRRSLADLLSHERSVGAFTAVAGTCVLGSQFVVFGVSTRVATGLLALGGGLWLLFTYGVVAGLTIGGADESLDAALDGSWFLLVVATQSVAVLAGLLGPTYPQYLPELSFAALALYSIGGAFYLVLLTLVFYRLAFFPVDPDETTPAYWINMGAVAITTLAGATLLALTSQWTFLAAVESFLLGLTVLFWAVGTWWIPLLVVLGVWRHTAGGVALPQTPAGYAPSYWGMVFPLGMYTAATHRLAAVADLSVLAPLPRVFVFVALAAWLLVSVGLVRSVLDRAREEIRREA